LAPFVDRFGDQLVVFLHDEVAADPERVYSAALDHLGAEPGFRPTDLAEVKFSNQQTKLTSPLTWSRARFWPTRKSPAKLRDDDRLELYEHFRTDVDALAELLGTDLSVWDPSLDATAPPASPAIAPAIAAALPAPPDGPTRPA